VKTESVEKSPRKRSWLDYSRALGRAHSKASLQLETSIPLLSHLEELRQRIFKAFAALALTTAISFIFAPQLIDFLAQPIGGSQALVSIEVTENIAIFMRVSLLCGITLGIPVIFYQALRFILPGLKQNERTWLLIVLPAASLLFLSGVAFAWVVLLPVAVPFLVNFLGIPTQVRPSNYFEFITRIMFWMGLSFEMPLVVFILAKLKFVNSKQLIGSWRYALVAAAVIAAAITPTIDPINMMLVMLPLIGLYIISIILAIIAGRE
jgi:sec-independent protein translocase protein TatC